MYGVTTLSAEDTLLFCVHCPEPGICGQTTGPQRACVRVSPCLLYPAVCQALADKKKGITDEDILALVGDEVHQAAVVWELIDLQVTGASSTDKELRD